MEVEALARKLCKAESNIDADHRVYDPGVGWRPWWSMWKLDAEQHIKELALVA